MVNCYLILLLSHLLTDFVFQSESMAKDKQSTNNKKRNRTLFTHSITFLATSLLLFAIVEGITWWPTIVIKPLSWTVFTWLLLISVSHYLVDLCKVIIQNKLKDKHKWDILVFVVDQIAHLGIIILTAGLLNRAEFINKLLLLVKFFNSNVILTFKPTHGQLVLIMMCIVIVTTSFSNIFIKISLTSIKMKILEDEEEIKIGRYIGAAERILTVAGIVAGAYEAIAALYAAKTAIRFSEAQGNTDFGEYFILGTSISAILGIVTGITLKRLVG